jgi:manganese-dependent inorganic pyrophosphatase
VREGLTIGIAQYENVTLDAVFEARDGVIAEMKRLAEARGWGLFLFMATNIIKEGSELFAVGDTTFAQAALKADFSADSAWLPGILSRKKQVAAACMETPLP